MQLSWAGTGAFVAALAIAITASEAEIMAPVKRLPADPPRIPLTRSIPVDLQTQAPDLLVKGLYGRRTPFLGKVSGYRKAFMPDLARALAQDAQPGELRIIDYDWRYGAPRKKARHLKLTTAVDGDTATVTARFRIGHNPDEIRYQLFRRRTGWRVHDVGHASSDTGLHSWSLRSCLRMRGSQLAKACDKPKSDPESMKPEPAPAIPARRPDSKPVPPTSVGSTVK